MPHRTDQHWNISDERDELLSLIMGLNDLEILPLLFKARRLMHGRDVHGPLEDLDKREDWIQEAVEEADDFVNYVTWSRAKSRERAAA